MKLFVGNLSFETTDRELEAAFSAYGRVTSAQVVTDRTTGRSRGFGFVEMPNATEARAAIQGLNRSQMHGRTLTVNEAEERPRRPAPIRRW